MLHQKAGGDILDRGDYRVMETMRLTALGTGKMRMTLAGPAVMSQLKMPGAVFQIGLVNQIVPDQSHQGAVNGGFIRSHIPNPLGDLFLCKRMFSVQQDPKNFLPRLCLPQTAGGQQVRRFIQSVFRHGCLAPNHFQKMIFLFDGTGYSRGDPDAPRRL